MAKQAVNKNGNYEVRIKKLYDDASLPIKATEEAACYDLVAHRIEMVGRNKAKVFFGIAAGIPEGFKLCIVPRSSFCLKSWVQGNTPGQVDEDYKGELMVFVEAIPTGIRRVTSSFLNGPSYRCEYNDFPYKPGERCAQMFLQEVIPSELVETDDIGESARGEGAFGSTGN